jgi:sialidase-1
MAVNDSGNHDVSVRAMEGIVRQAKRINPHIDICFLYLANKSGSDQFSSIGRMQDNIYNHEEVAEHYRIPSVHIAGEIYRRIESGELRWEEMSGDDVHPNDFGYSLYGQFLQDFLGEALQKGHANLVENSLVLPLQMDSFCYESADLLSPLSVERVSGWRMEKNWTSEQTCNWTPPADIFVGEEPGASFQIRFTGTAAGFSMLAGMDIGNVDVSIDGGAYQTVSLFDSYCTMFYRPKIVLFADDLSPGIHTFDIRISEEKDEQSTGHAICILNVLVN